MRMTRVDSHRWACSRGVTSAVAAQAQTPLDSYLAHLKTLRAEFSQTVTDSKGREVQSARRQADHRASRQIPLGARRPKGGAGAAAHGRRRQEPLVLRSRSRAGIGEAGDDGAHRDAGRAAVR